MATSKSGFSVTARKQPELVKAQRAFMRLVADRIEKGEPFARTGERKLVAGILRAWAGQLPDTLSDDGDFRVDPGYAAIHFAWLVNGQGASRADAARQLAELYTAAPDDILDAIATHEALAMRLVPKASQAARADDAHTG